MFNNFIREDKLELTGVNSRIDNIEEQQSTLSESISGEINTIKGNVNNLQAQIDGEVSSYFMEGTPRNNYRPSSEWTDNTLKQRHLGDTYTNILPYEIDLTALDKDNKLFWFEKGSVQGNVGDSFDDMFVDSDNHYRTKCLITTDNLEGGSVDFFMVNSISDSISDDFNISIYYFNNNNQCVGTASGYSNGTEYGFELLIDTTYHYAIIVFEVSDITDIRLQQYNITKYINPDAGKSYRWCNYDDEDNTTFHWHPIADSDAIRALQKVDDLNNEYQSDIKQVKDDISNIEKEIDSIEIGGRNLLTGTQTGKGFTFDINSNLPGSTGNFNKETRCFELKCAKNTDTALTDGILLYSPKLFLTPGKYTLSFDYKYDGILNRMQTYCIAYNDGDIIDNNNTMNLDADIQGELNLNWSKYKYTFIIKEESKNVPYWKIRIDYDHRVNHTEDQILYIKDLQLEIGNQATDYTPAPEDNLPYLSGNAGCVLYHDGDEWVSSSDINDINDSYILTSGGGDFTPKWLESSIGNSDVKFSLLTYKNNMGLEWLLGPNVIDSNGSNSILTTMSGGVGLAWNTLPLEDSLIYTSAGKIQYLPIPDSSENMILTHNVDNGFCWSDMESIRGTGYIHVMGEYIDDLIMEDPINTSSLVITFKFKPGDYTITTNGTIWYYNGTSFERGINLKS